MPEVHRGTVSPADAAALSSAFVKTLARQLRAHDLSGIWDRKPDQDLLAQFIMTREHRRKIPIIADPDAKKLWQLQVFYNAVGLTMTDEVGVMVTPLINLSHEGFGRVVLIAGRLVVVSRQLRDVHRFGFDSLTHLATEGEGLVDAGIEAIRRFPEVAEG
ncbi:MAG: NifX-associated nitrogen fixation protein [Hyphomicrobium sp.]